MKEYQNKFKDFFRPENKKARMNLFTLFALGILLLLMGNSFFGFPKQKQPEVVDKPQETVESITKENELEKRMKEVLSQIEGAGAVEVMITYRQSTKSVLATEEKSEESTSQESGGQGGTKSVESRKLESTVVLKEDQSGNKTPLVLTEEVPVVEGVVIVAQGGGDALVCNALTQAAQALLNVPAHKVAILKMK